MIISVHIPKTGGTTLQTILTRSFGSDLLFEYEAAPTKKPFVLDVLDAWLYRFSKAQPAPSTRCIHGHFLALRYTHIPSAKFATWVRDPLQLVPSLYYFWLRSPETAQRHPLCRKVVEQKMSLEEFAALPQLWNLQTKFLVGVPVSKLAFVGLTEKFDLSVRLFTKIFNLPEDPGYTARNQNPQRGNRYDLDPSFEDRVRRWNHRDFALYERCRQRFEDLCKEHNLNPSPAEAPVH